MNGSIKRLFAAVIEIVSYIGISAVVVLCFLPLLDLLLRSDSLATVFAWALGALLAWTWLDGWRLPTSALGKGIVLVSSMVAACSLFALLSALLPRTQLNALSENYVLFRAFGDEPANVVAPTQFVEQVINPWIPAASLFVSTLMSAASLGISMASIRQRPTPMVQAPPQPEQPQLGAPNGRQTGAQPPSGV